MSNTNQSETKDEFVTMTADHLTHTRQFYFVLGVFVGLCLSVFLIP